MSLLQAQSLPLPKEIVRSRQEFIKTLKDGPIINKEFFFHLGEGWSFFPLLSSHCSSDYIDTRRGKKC